MQMLLLITLALVLVGPARAGSIFDDDFVPPKPVDRPQASDPAAPTKVPDPSTPAPSDAPDDTHATTPKVVRPPSDAASPDVVAARPALRQQAIPAKADLTHSRTLLKSVFADQLKDRSLAARRKLAQALLDESEKPDNSPADRFALLTGAIDAAREGASLQLCARAAGKLSDAFPVDDLKVEAQAATNMTLRPTPPADAADNVTAGLALVDSLADAEEFPDAFRVLGVLRAAAAGSPELHAAVTKRGQSLEAARAASERIKPTLEKLKASPSDPAANLAAGEYYCFRVAQWDRGLPLLSNGADPRLAELAREDRAARGDSASALKVADAWWDRAELKATPEVDARAIKLHAAALYRSSKSAASGLAAKVVEQRLQQAASLIASDAGGAAHGGANRGPATIVNGLGMKFVRIAPGSFVMGSPPNEPERGESEKQHKVTLTHGFYLGTTLVTRGQWKAVMDGDQSALETALTPVDSVSYDRAVSFCKKLSESEGKSYRLPTEAEWEYACRAGTTTPFGPDKLGEVAWFRDNSGNHVHPVALKKPNAWGLYDMHGNLWQWCSDYYAPYPPGPVVDPTGPASAGAKMTHVKRGGSWFEGSDVCRAACRSHGTPDNYGDDRYGMRVCLDAAQ